MDSEFYYRRPTQIPPGSSQERDLSWKCGVCGYYVLSIDQSGKGLPLEPGPSGAILPLTCPRCRQEHTHWTPMSPFDAFGDHANLPSALSSRVTHGASIFDNVHRRIADQSSKAAEHQREVNNSSYQQPQQQITGGGGGTPTKEDNISSLGMSTSLRSTPSKQQTTIIQQQQTTTENSTSSRTPTPGSVRTPTPSFAEQHRLEGGGGLLHGGGGVSSTSFEYEYLADHEALQDPDVAEALQRLRRRRGAYNNPAATATAATTNNYRGITAPSSRELLTDDQLSRLPETSLQRAAAHRSTAPKPLETYVCGICQRRLLRIDHKGELIPLELDAEGNYVSLECPGCHHTHTQWIKVPLSGTTSHVALK